MLISTKRLPLLNGDVKLDRSLLGPLSLNEGNKFFAIHDLKQPHRRSEILLTTIPPSSWPDLWRIEIETTDTPGNLFELSELFSKLSIDIVASEGSTNTFGKLHSMTFIACCKKYASKRDGTSPKRIADLKLSLSGLEFLLKLHFVDQLSFNDREEPSIKVRRISTYWQLYNDVNHDNSRIIASKDGITLENHAFKVDVETLDQLHKAHGDRLFYTSALDTKTRIIRILFFSSDSDGPEHIQFFLPKNQSDCMAQIFKIIFQRNCNVIRYQLRPGINPEIVAVHPSALSEYERPSRLDITYESISPKGNAKAALKIVEMVRRDPLLRANNVSICKSWSRSIQDIED